jgi:hypothetical protein
MASDPRGTARRPVLLAGAGLVLMGAVLRPRASRFDFDDTVVGAQLQGFSFALTGGGAPVRWAMREDPSSPAGPRVLAETNKDRTDDRSHSPSWKGRRHATSRSRCNSGPSPDVSTRRPGWWCGSATHETATSRGLTRWRITCASTASWMGAGSSS